MAARSAPYTRTDVDISREPGRQGDQPSGDGTGSRPVRVAWAGDLDRRASDSGESTFGRRYATIHQLSARWSIVLGWVCR